MKMYHSLQWAGHLNALLENNFFVAKCYKKTSEQIEDVHLKNYLQKQASKRIQFAFELGREIKFLGCAPSPLKPVIPFRTALMNTSEENAVHLLKNCINTDKSSIKEYKKAIPKINHGSSREILLRHKAIIKATVSQLKKMKLELVLNEEGQDQMRKIK